MNKRGAPVRFTGHVRLWETLRDQGPMEVKVLAQAAHLSVKRTRECVNELHECGLIHVKAWRPVTICGGHPAKVWAHGFGKSAPKPEAGDENALRLRSFHRRKAALIKQYGIEIWRKMSRSRAKGGSDKIVIDGRVIYQRRIQQKRSEA